MEGFRTEKLKNLDVRSVKPWLLCKGGATPPLLHKLYANN